MLNDLYNKKILSFAAEIPHLERLEAPDGTAKAHSRLCGSTVIVDVKLNDGVVSAFGHDVKACALGQASSSIMARHVIGSDQRELVEIRDRMTAMLKGEQPADFDGKWSDLNVLEPIKDFKSRHASTLLTFNAVVDAVDQALDAGRNVPATANA